MKRDNRQTTARILHLKDWELDPQEVNEQIYDMNGEEMLIVSVGTFKPNGSNIVHKLHVAMQSSRCGIISLKHADEERSRIMDNFQPVTGPIVAISSSVLRFNKFLPQFKSFKYAIADLCNRASLDSVKMMTLYLPEVRFYDVPADSSSRSERSAYEHEWKSVMD